MAFNGSVVIGVISSMVTLQFLAVEAGVPPVTPNGVRWIFNDIELTQERTLNFSEDRLSVTIATLTPAYEGNYTIIVSNPAGSDSDTLFLDVEGKTNSY